MRVQELFVVNLHLFAEGGAGTGSSDAAAGTTAQGDKNSSASTRQKGEYANVKFGVQDSATAATDTASSSAENTGGSTDNTANQGRTSFEDLINGDYKEDFTKKTQEIINKRFKETKNLEKTVESYEPLMAMLEQKYGTRNAEELSAKIESDTALWQDAADEAGMDVEQYKEIQRLKRENAALKAQEEKSSQQQYINQKMLQWDNEAKELVKTFPNFDLQTEAQNPEFVNMLKAGVPMEHAYKVIHYDEIMSGTVNKVAGDMQKAVTDHIRARGQRPQENGSSQSSPFTVKDDVSKLSKADREEIVRRVQMGESIRF